MSTLSVPFSELPTRNSSRDSSKTVRQKFTSSCTKQCSNNSTTTRSTLRSFILEPQPRSVPQDEPSYHSFTRHHTIPSLHLTAIYTCVQADPQEDEVSSSMWLQSQITSESKKIKWNNVLRLWNEYRWVDSDRYMRRTLPRVTQAHRLAHPRRIRTPVGPATL